jgi:glycosyltransferase involved in cell wall biosynthesis
MTISACAGGGIVAASAGDSVSIIIATRNRSKILAQCLAALPAGVGELPPPQIIVVDDCSRDATRQVAEEFATATGWEVICRSKERPLGANAARNEGLKIASGQIIVFIDDDVIVTEGWLGKLLGGLSPKTSVVTGPMRLTVEGPLLGKHREEVSGYFSEFLSTPLGLGGEVVPVLGNMAAPRWVFENTKFLDTLRPPVEEIDWLRRSGLRAGFVPEAIVWHYKEPEDIQLKRLLKVAWSRGSEGGWWAKEMANADSRQVWPMVAQSLRTAARSFGHACSQLCWGGVVVGVGELSRALALGGLINRGPRVPESWR